MAYREFTPAPPLQPLVGRLWVMDHDAPGTAYEHRLLPERLARLTFASAPNWERDGREVWTPRPAALLAGLTVRPRDGLVRGAGRVLGAELFPWGAKQLFGWQADAPLDLSDRPEAVAITALLGAGNVGEAREVLEDWLLRRLRVTDQEPGRGVQAARVLYTTPGEAKVTRLAQALNVSVRQLEREFVREVGVTPKTLARLIRFGEVQDRLGRQPGGTLTALAHDLNFTDQAHLNREFRALAHMAPGQYLKFLGRRQAAEGIS